MSVSAYVFNWIWRLYYTTVLSDGDSPWRIFLSSISIFSVPYKGGRKKTQIVLLFTDIAIIVVTIHLVNGIEPIIVFIGVSYNSFCCTSYLTVSLIELGSLKYIYLLKE